MYQHHLVSVPLSLISVCCSTVNGALTFDRHCIVFYQGIPSRCKSIYYKSVPVLSLSDIRILYTYCFCSNVYSKNIIIPAFKNISTFIMDCSHFIQTNICLYTNVLNKFEFDSSLCQYTMRTNICVDYICIYNI